MSVHREKISKKCTDSAAKKRGKEEKKEKMIIIRCCCDLSLRWNIPSTNIASRSQAAHSICLSSARKFFFPLLRSQLRLLSSIRLLLLRCFISLPVNAITTSFFSMSQLALSCVEYLNIARRESHQFARDVCSFTNKFDNFYLTLFESF